MNIEVRERGFDLPAHHFNICTYQLEVFSTHLSATLSFQVIQSVTFVSPSCRWLNLSKRSLNHPQKGHIRRIARFGWFFFSFLPEIAIHPFEVKNTTTEISRPNSLSSFSAAVLTSGPLPVNASRSGKSLQTLEAHESTVDKPTESFAVTTFCVYHSMVSRYKIVSDVWKHLQCDLYM